MSLEWTIGAGEVDVVLDHPTVSGCHACLSEKAGALFLRDLDSTNGTRLQRHGQYQPVTTDTRLRAGDQLHFGAFSIRFDELLQRLPGQPYAVGPAPSPTPTPPKPAPAVPDPVEADRPRVRCLGCAHVIAAGITCPHCGTGPAPA